MADKKKDKKKPSAKKQVTATNAYQPGSGSSYTPPTTPVTGPQGKLGGNGLTAAEDKAASVGKLKLLGQVLSGKVSVDDVTKEIQKRFATIDWSKFTYSDADLKKLGLTKGELDKAEFKDLKAALKRAAASGGKLGAKELTTLKGSLDKAVRAEVFADLSEKASENILDPPDLGGSLAEGDESAFKFGNFHFDYGSILAGRMVGKARGIKDAIGTSATGDAGFGTSLWSPKVGKATSTVLAGLAAPGLAAPPATSVTRSTGIRPVKKVSTARPVVTRTSTRVQSRESERTNQRDRSPSNRRNGPSDSRRRASRILTTERRPRSI